MALFERPLTLDERLALLAAVDDAGQHALFELLDDIYAQLDALMAAHVVTITPAEDETSAGD